MKDCSATSGHRLADPSQSTFAAATVLAGNVRDYHQQLATRHLGLDENGLTTMVNAMQSEYILGEINANGDHAQGLPLSTECFNTEIQSWQQQRRRLPPPLQDMEVPFIR